MFLVVGALFGPGFIGWIKVDPGSTMVLRFAELAMFSTLFFDGVLLDFKTLVRSSRLPGRALLAGLPLTVVGNALFARWLLGLPWLEAFIVGAVLAPTDPVFATAIIEHHAVPVRLRRLLAIESSVNDGLILPVVVLLIGNEPEWVSLVAVISGVLAGVVIPWLFVRLERSRLFAASEHYRPLAAVGIAVALYGLSSVLHYNVYLAAFAGGVSVATFDPELAQAFQPLGRHLAELFKLSAVLVFGALLTPSMLTAVGWSGYVFVVCVLIVVRPLALLVSLLRPHLSWREFIAAAWFGPKGFASIAYGLLALATHVHDAPLLFEYIAIATAGSIIAHSSTDVIVARAFMEDRALPIADGGEHA
jgi:NhaP-type Na+/H+ or K+/H+ antiporter